MSNGLGVVEGVCRVSSECRVSRVREGRRVVAVHARLTTLDSRERTLV